MSPASARCMQCHAEYAIGNGVLCTGRSEVFLGEFDAARMREFTRSARELGWHQVVERMCVAEPAARPLLLSPARANFIDILKVPVQQSVLDLGAGMGAVSLRLAKSFERVFAVDQTRERLEFLQVIAEQQGITNIQSVCHRDACHLPFASDSLNAVVMIGVFEYFPLSYPEVPVQEVQRRALAEINRVLAPGGVLFLATKNRFGWPHWAGAKDNSGLRFGPMLPRGLADVASRWLLGSPFRVITDSLNGYRSLLREAGFAEPEFHWPVGGYQSPRSWADLQDRSAVIRGVRAGYPEGLKGWALQRLAMLGLLKYVVPHFGIVARKE